MNEKTTIDHLIDQRLGEHSGISGNPSRTQMLGDILAAWAEWDGVDLLQALSYALKNTNFHAESAIVDEMVNIINGGDTAANYQLVKKPAVSAAGLPGELFTKLKQEQERLNWVERDLNSARRGVKAIEAEIASALNVLYKLRTGDSLYGTPAFQQWVEDNRHDLLGNFDGVLLFIDAADSPTTIRVRWDMGRRLPIDGVPLDIALEMRKAYLKHRQEENAKLSDERHVPTTDPARSIQVTTRTTPEQAHLQPDEIPWTPPYGDAPSGDE